MRRPFRTVPVLLASVALVAGLAACSGTKAGSAAVVGGTRISQDTVENYVVTNAAAPSASTSSSVAPKAIALSTLIQQDVLQTTLAANGGVPSDGELAGLHDQVFSVLLGATGLSGSAADAAVRERISAPNNLTTAFDSLFLRTEELELALVDRQKLTSQAEVSALVAKQDIGIQVNPRYGQWDAANLSLTSAQTPSFLTLGGTSSASASASPSASTAP